MTLSYDAPERSEADRARQDFAQRCGQSTNVPRIYSRELAAVIAPRPTRKQSACCLRARPSPSQLASCVFTLNSSQPSHATVQYCTAHCTRPASCYSILVCPCKRAGDDVFVFVREGKKSDAPAQITSLAHTLIQWSMSCTGHASGSIMEIVLRSRSLLSFTSLRSTVKRTGDVSS